MKLYEYEAKAILAANGIQTPKGELAATSLQAKYNASKLGLPVAIKAQVLVAGRGNAGGILFADKPEDAESMAKQLLGAQINGLTVTSVLVEQKIRLKKELYFGITIDRFNRCLVAVASEVGGSEIEEIASEHPEKIHKQLINPQIGFRRFHGRQIAQELGYTGEQMQKLTEILVKLYETSVKYEAELAEMNPLVETSEGEFVAVDARFILDDNALFRHEEFYRKRHDEQRELSLQEFDALKNGLDYVKLDGNIGVFGNGAGLVMATLDMISLYGGKPANFLDMGGGAPPERILSAFKTVLSNPQVRVLLVNILGGITLCDEVARGIIQARGQLGTDKPIVIRLVGTNEEEGKSILAQANLPFFDSMEAAAEKAVEFAEQEPQSWE